MARDLEGPRGHDLSKRGLEGPAIRCPAGDCRQSPRGGRSRHRPLPGRPDDQDPCRGRCARPAHPVPDNTRALGRLPAGTRAARRAGGRRPCHRGCRLRRRSPARFHRHRTRGNGADQAEPVVQRTQTHRLDARQGAQPRRAFFNLVKRFRRIALRCQKTVASFQGFVALACAMAWLRERLKNLLIFVVIWQTWAS